MKIPGLRMGGLKKATGLAVQENTYSDKDLQQKAKEILLAAREEAFRLKQEAEEEARKIREESFELERRLSQKTEEADRRIRDFEEREKVFIAKQEDLQNHLGEAERIKQEQLAKLEKIAVLSKEEARALILQVWELRLKEEIAKRIKDAESETKQEIDKRVREILSEAMLRGATDYVPEYTVSMVKVSEEIKGKIIGKEGRNIRAFEQATNVDVDLEGEGELRLSSFDPMRREVARVALNKLIADGRIQPVRIEEVVALVKKDIEKVVYLEGEKLCQGIGIYHLPPEIIGLLGRFKYRFSYGQNLILHTLEETRIGVKLAQELKADVNVVRLACLLHDIGKVITEEEGDHVSLGVELLKKYRLPEAVINCVAEHHEDKPFSSTEAILVYVADAISGARPGARYTDYEAYTERMKALEDIAKTFNGVKDVYALAAGRELRVIVKAEEIDDVSMTKLAADIKNKIETDKIVVPGNVKITVIREMRVTETTGQNQKSDLKNQSQA